MPKSTKGSSQGSKPWTNGSKQGGQSLSTFDEKALLALTQKIEKGFGAKKSPQQKSDNRNEPKKKTSNTPHPNQSKPNNKTKDLETKQGKKRDARGNRKPQNGESIHGEHSKRPANGNTQDERDVLLQEILAMGGTEDDLQLIADAVSDDELEEDNSATQDKSLRADLAKFVAGLGIDTKMKGVGSEIESEQEVDDEWETSGEESSDRAASSVKIQPTEGVPMKTIIEDKSLETSSSKIPGRLVGTSSQLMTDNTNHTRYSKLDLTGMPRLLLLYLIRSQKTVHLFVMLLLTLKTMQYHCSKLTATFMPRNTFHLLPLTDSFLLSCHLVHSQTRSQHLLWLSKNPLFIRESRLKACWGWPRRGAGDRQYRL